MNQEVLTLKSKTNLSCKICDRCCKYRGDIKLAPISVLEISKFLKSLLIFLDSTLKGALKVEGERKIRC